MKLPVFILGSLTFYIVLALFSCASDSDGSGPVIDPKDVKSSSNAVIDVSGKNAMPTQYKVDGLLSSNTAQIIGSNKVVATYIPIEAGLRKVSIGNYSDTLRIHESNYYTVMVYDNDSIRLSLDATYGDSQFNTAPQIRWVITDEDPKDYRVDIKSDTLLLKDVKVNTFASTLIEKSALLFLYRRGEDKELFKGEVPTKLNSKETVKFTKDSSTKGYAIGIFSQNVKL